MVSGLRFWRVKILNIHVTDPLRRSGDGQSPLMVRELWNCKRIVEIYRKSLSLSLRSCFGV